uniref:Uncharacterized protein n=1 Tax=Oryza brachyantha TaxID=4533 RepID=J3LW88_ORYBR
MSYAVYKMMHWPTGVDHCAAGFITHSPLTPLPSPPPPPAVVAGPGPVGDIDSVAAEAGRPRRLGPTPNLVVVAANVLEVYAVRADTVAEEGGGGARRPPRSAPCWTVSPRRAWSWCAITGCMETSSP